MRRHAGYKKGDLHFLGSQINFSKAIGPGSARSGINGRDHEGKIMRELLFGEEKEQYDKKNKHGPTSEKS